MLPQALEPGQGRLALMPSASDPTRASFVDLSAQYPLKLLAPRVDADGELQRIGLAYLLSYGGGLVATDMIDLRCSVGEGCALVLLTQGNTKVLSRCSRTLAEPSGLQVAGAI